jgi:hypothetical protein
MIDLRSKNVKCYHFVNFSLNVIVLGYSLNPETFAILNSMLKIDIQNIKAFVSFSSALIHGGDKTSSIASYQHFQQMLDGD